MSQAWGEGEKERQIVQTALRDAEGNYLRCWQKARLLRQAGFTWMLLFSVEGSGSSSEVGWLTYF